MDTSSMFWGSIDRGLTGSTGRHDFFIHLLRSIEKDIGYFYPGIPAGSNKLTWVKLRRTMSRHSSHEHSVALDPGEALAIIREEQCSPALSTCNIDAAPRTNTHEDCPKDLCTCAKLNEKTNKQETNDYADLLNKREKEMRAEFEMVLEREINALKDRFDLILQNEQIRASCMLREAHRERQEKITALRTQLECKNMAGLMYVMCSERRRSKLDKMRTVEEYTNYIHALQDILADGQSLILNLSRGYKTAARVDHEWREKMKKVMTQFKNFIYHFTGGTPEMNQYFFDMPELLRTKTPTVDNPDEDPCEPEEVPEQPIEVDDSEKKWWERLDGDNRPFLMFGDMAEFKPPQRREVLRNVKASRTAPRRWKEYLFNEMFLKTDCENLDVIKDEYMNRFPVPTRWECQAMQTQESPSDTFRQGHRATSVDVRGNMGSILKIITTSSAAHPPTPKTDLLAARDSMEIASTTKLRVRRKDSHGPENVVLNIAERRASKYAQEHVESDPDDVTAAKPGKKVKHDVEDDDEDDEDATTLKNGHTDSLEVIPGHIPDRDHRIHYEKVCPVEKCQRMHVDSFMRSLPPYMRASPFTHFEQNYEDYEACSPEQIKILKQRLEDKKKKERIDLDEIDDSPEEEWTPSVEGVAVQTSALSLSLPPCTCREPYPSPAPSSIKVFRLEDLLPLKQALDEIRRDCFYDSTIEFNRFGVIGQEEKQDAGQPVFKNNEQNFVNTRLQEIRTILKEHPSLCDLFQANTKC